MTDITFSVNDYDQDGDVCDEGVYLHFGETRVKVARDLRGFQAVVDRIATIANEMEGLPEIVAVALKKVEKVTP